MKNRFFYCRLAATNITRNRRNYVPYLLTCTVTVAMLYMISSLSSNSDVAELRGGVYVQSLMTLGAIVTAIFAAVFLFYTHSFLIKQRKREFGLYNILGLEKKHIFLVVMWETVYIAAISLTLGLGSGILLDKLMYLILARLMGDVAQLGFYVSTPSIVACLCLFGGIHLCTLFSSVVRIGKNNPAELLNSQNAGEREPRAKWIISLLGLVTLGAGYYISIVTESPLDALALFFVAVILVIIGTYLLFTTGSIALLKLLKKNKRFYYKPTHFINVSGMLFRMKQNAVGLANICILSTMVLVMLSTTTSLWLGLEEQLTSTCPRDIVFNIYNSDSEYAQHVLDVAEQTARDNGVDARNRMVYEYLHDVGNMTEAGVENSDDTQSFSPRILMATLEDYNRYLGTDYTLEEGEALLYSNDNDIHFERINVFGQTLSVREYIKQPMPNDVNNRADSIVWVIVPSRDIIAKADEYLSKEQSMIDVFCGIDVGDDPELQQTIANRVANEISDAPPHYGYYYNVKGIARNDFTALYGGLFFIGVFLSVLFVMAAILIIYYKQISEGMDDKRRFEIMQNVGLSKSEVKKSINSQILTIFFLPLAVAGMHLAFSYPIIRRMFMLIELANASLFAICMAASFLVFAVLYRLIFSLTARVYYRIVSSR